MAIYHLHYEWKRKGKKLGESTIRFSAISDDEARETAAKRVQEFRESNPGVDYYHIKIMKEVRTTEEI